MKTNVNDWSTCRPGEEQWEESVSSLTGQSRVQYDYCSPDGVHFSCVAPTLEEARQHRDRWLASIAGIQRVSHDWRYRKPRPPND